MDVGSFQFLTSLLEFSAALNLGFAISDAFRSQPRKAFEKTIQQWMRLQAAENTTASPTGIEKRVEADIAKSKLKGETAEGYRVIFCRRVGIACLVMAMLVCLVPLPLFAPHANVLLGFYLFVWLFILVSLGNVGYTYKCLHDLWETELDHIERAAELNTGKDINQRIDPRT